MRARITVSLSRRGEEFSIWVNEAGRDLLVRELQNLSKKNDHFHLDPDGIVGVRVSTRPYREDDKILEWGKVYLRPDEWDARHFPHVFDDSTEAGDR